MKGDINVDFVMAVILFVSVYAMLYVLLPSATISFKKTPDPLATASYYFSDVLVTTPGIPAEWTSVSGVSRLGFAYGNNVTSYANILDARKVGAIDGQACSSLKTKTDLLLDFAIQVESSSKTYSCTATIPGIARLIERPGYLKNGTAYAPIKIKIWTW
jgi:hypothetical protein